MQVPPQNAVAPSETHRTELIQDEASSRVSGEISEQEVQQGDETSPPAQVGSPTVLPPPTQMEASPESTTPSALAAPLAMGQCQACGAKLQPGGAFCPQCGNQLQAAYTLQNTYSLPPPSSLPAQSFPSLHIHTT